MSIVYFNAITQNDVMNENTLLQTFLRSLSLMKTQRVGVYGLSGSHSLNVFFWFCFCGLFRSMVFIVYYLFLGLIC